jgi:starch synthase
LGVLSSACAEYCLFTFVGRLTAQKAPDVMLRAVDEVFAAERKAALCILGDSDDPRLREKIQLMIDRFAGRVVVLTGFSDALAAEIYGAGDFFLMPSRFEPCGLTDLIAQLNGNIPIVNQVGGLAKVIDGKTGLAYFALNDRMNLRGLVQSMRRALDLYANRVVLDSMRSTAALHVRTNYTWERAFASYLELYGLNLRSKDT